jgi:hypothetical protein
MDTPDAVLKEGIKIAHDLIRSVSESGCNTEEYSPSPSRKFKSSKGSG